MIFNKKGEPALPSGFPQFRSASLLRNGFAAATIPLAVVMISLLFSCSSKNQNEQKNLIKEQESPVESVAENINSDSSILDFDLTKMNANMVYAQIFNLMMEPEKYDGKIFKMTGNFIKVNDPDGKPAYAVIIKDALACCQQGVEFKYPFNGNEPGMEALITVTGAFTVKEDSNGFIRSYVMAEKIEL